MAEENRKLRWMRLDNAALIFPAALRKHWSNSFRISVSFTDPVDPDILQRALDRTAPRFPSVCVRLCRSFFWYYLEELERAPSVRADGPQPLVTMTGADVKKCAIRVLYYRDRMAVEFFHSVTDGSGGLVFVKTLAAEYVRLRYGADVPCECGIKDIGEAPSDDELEDSFQEAAGPVRGRRDDRNVYKTNGTLEPDRFLHVTTGIVSSEALIKASKQLGVTVTGYLAAVLFKGLIQMQDQDVKKRSSQKDVRIQIPVNLRKLYGSNTMRNFVAVANLSVDPRLGDYSLEELADIVHHQMHLLITKKNMRTIFTPNVRDEQNRLMKPIPLFIKNIVMRMVFDAIGESVSCMSLSNLGSVQLPEAMMPYVERVEFVLGPQAGAPYNCSVTSFGGKTFITVVRNTKEPRLERLFFTELVKLGFPVKIESNDRE